MSTCQASSDHTIGLRDCLGRGLGLITPACPSSGMFFHSGAGPSGRRVCKRSEVGGGGGWGVCRKEKLTLSRTRPPTLVLALGTLGRTHVRKTLHCACPPPPPAPWPTSTHIGAPHRPAGDPSDCADLGNSGPASAAPRLLRGAAPHTSPCKLPCPKFRAGPECPCATRTPSIADAVTSARDWTNGAGPSERTASRSGASLSTSAASASAPAPGRMLRNGDAVAS